MARKQLIWISGTDADIDNYTVLADNSTRLYGARAVKVGQGNAVAVLTDDQEIAFYFDVGTGCFWNAGTQPADLDQRLDFSDEPLIILSHWDGDHWYAGGKVLFASAQNCRWLAPRQQISPMHQALAASLKKKLRLWPKNRTEPLEVLTGGGAVQIDKCTGDERNYSGLAVTLTNEDHPDEVQMIVLPGDAGFQHIPALDSNGDHHIDGEVVGLMATHHGSRTHLQDIPDVSHWGGTITYSYGAGNGYGHPAAEAVNAYEAQDWKNDQPNDIERLNTPTDDGDMPFYEDT